MNTTNNHPQPRTSYRNGSCKTCMRTASLVCLEMMISAKLDFKVKTSYRASECVCFGARLSFGLTSISATPLRGIQDLPFHSDKSRRSGMYLRLLTWRNWCSLRLKDFRHIEHWYRRLAEACGGSASAAVLSMGGSAIGDIYVWGSGGGGSGEETGRKLPEEGEGDEHPGR